MTNTDNNPLKNSLASTSFSGSFSDPAVMRATEAMGEREISNFERRPCPACGHMLSILRLGQEILYCTCPYCNSELRLFEKGDARSGASRQSSS